MGRLWIQLLMVIQIFTTIFAESHYSIIAPGTIRSNRKYSVGVTLHQARAPATIRVAITSPTSSLNLSQDVTLQPHETKLVEFMVPRLLAKFEYELQARGVRGIDFNEKSSLYVVENGGPRIYVESDRGIYKPEDTVQFRVIILDEHLRTVNIVEPIRIQILDADSNRIKQFKDIHLKRGVFAEKFLLSKHPVLGKWTILVHLSGKYNMNHEYQFQVEEYVLPKFSVHIDTDPNFVAKDRFVRATVYAKYTYGKYVEGTVDVYLLDAESNRTDISPNATVVIDKGAVKADVVLDYEKMIPYPKLVFIAVVKEHFTNITATAETTLNVRKMPYNIIVAASGIESSDKLPYYLKVQVQYWNGTIVKDSSKPIDLIVENINYKSYIDSDGIAQFKFKFQPRGGFWISYGGSIVVLMNLYVPLTSFDFEVQTCQIQWKGISSEDFKVPMEFEVTTNEAIPYLIYAVVSHGNIIRYEYVRVPSNKKTHTIHLNISIDIIPQSYLYVHYIVNNQLRYCEFAIRLPQKFENEISITAPTSVKPGQEITMNVKGQPNSHISIIAVDKSSLLLNTDNVLKKSAVMKDLLYDRSYKEKHGTLYYPGFVSGLITMTNAKFETQDLDVINEPLPHQGDDVYPRSIFPETWIFEDLELDGTGTSLQVKVPDTITTWIVRAFSVNDHTGFGMMDTTLDIQAFKPFFISTNLPYSVKRGEVVTIPITIFNYLHQNYDTEVSLDNTKQEFTFMDSQNKPVSKTKDIRNVNIPADSGKSVAFVIKPKKVGDIDIRITATNRESSDTIIQKLKVKPEGIKKQFNLATTLNLVQGKSQKTTFQALIPNNIVPESEYVVLSVSGDVMVPTLENLENLVLKPSGCGEQNMINFAPNILVLDYLKTLNQFDNLTELVAQAQQNINTGYQQELTYRHQGGGYSVFGPNGSSAESNWLTAYVTRFFIKGMKYTFIESRIIYEGLAYLAKQQATNGCFLQRGYLFYPAHQNEYGFTAFVLMAYLEDPKYSKKFSTVIEKGMQFLTANLNSISDPYSLSIVANVFQATANSHTNEIIRKLKQMAHEENGLMWWTNNKKKRASANSVEITSYALMALLETSGHYSPIFNWLLKQRSSSSGFGSTHDTVVGLQALIKYSEKSLQGSTEEAQLKVHYVANDKKGQNVKEHFLGVNTENLLVLQQQELPFTARSVDVEVMGQGNIFLQLAYQYYVSTSGQQLVENVVVPALHFNDQTSVTAQAQSISMESTKEHEYFKIKPSAKLSSNSMSMTLAICYSYQPLTTDESFTNMVILQVQLPSSFVSNNENIKKLKEEDQVSRVELQNSSTMLAIYFEQLEANNEQCLTIVGDKMHEVTSLKPSTIKMYDYYNPEERSEILYKINGTN